MGTLMKYEIKKSKLLLFITFGVVLITELAWLIGFYGKIETLSIIATILLLCFGVISAFIGMLFSITLYNDDLKKKSGYMLFMTPRSTIQIIASKVIVSFCITVALVILLSLCGMLDFSLFYKSTDPDALFTQILKPIANTFKENPGTIILIIFNLIIQVFANIAIIYAAIALSKSVLGNKKGSGFIAFLFWLGFTIVISLITSFVDKIVANNSTGFEFAFTNDGLSLSMPSQTITVFVLALCLNLVFSVIFYGITIWLTDKKLSL